MRKRRVNAECAARNKGAAIAPSIRLQTIRPKLSKSGVDGGTHLRSKLCAASQLCRVNGPEQLARGLLIYLCTRNDRRVSVAGIGAGAGKVHPGGAEGSDVGGRPAPHFLCLSTPLGAKSATPAQGRNRGDPLIPWRALRLKLAPRARALQAVLSAGVDQGSIVVGSRPDETSLARSRA